VFQYFYLLHSTLIPGEDTSKRYTHLNAYHMQNTAVNQVKLNHFPKLLQG